MSSGGKFCSHCEEDGNGLDLWKELRWRWLGGKWGFSSEQTRVGTHVVFIFRNHYGLHAHFVLKTRSFWSLHEEDLCELKRFYFGHCEKKKFISLLHFIHLFLPVLQYPLKEQIHLRMFILSWYSGLKSFSICFCPAFDITFCRWQHLSESHCRLLTGFVPSEMGCVHHHCNFAEMGGVAPWVNLSHHHKCFLKYHPVLWAQWLRLDWLV